MTVSRRQATHAWGAWAVTWPDDYTGPELEPDHSLGYLAQLQDQPTGRFGRRFVRADIDINAADGWSTTEDTLDTATTRVEGDIFFERDITRAGLGRLVPKQHFDIGDLVPVRLWGKILVLPVTGIEMVTGPEAVVDWRVHVGGQLIRNAKSLKGRNEEVMRQIATERRQRLKQVGKAQSTATEARSAAQQASEKATHVESQQKLNTLSISQITVDMQSSLSRTEELAGEVESISIDLDTKAGELSADIAAAGRVVDSLALRTGQVEAAASAASQEAAAALRRADQGVADAKRVGDQLPAITDQLSAQQAAQGHLFRMASPTANLLPRDADGTVMMLLEATQPSVIPTPDMVATSGAGPVWRISKNTQWGVPPAVLPHTPGTEYRFMIWAKHTSGTSRSLFLNAVAGNASASVIQDWREVGSGASGTGRVALVPTTSGDWHFTDVIIRVADVADLRFMLQMNTGNGFDLYQPHLRIFDPLEQTVQDYNATLTKKADDALSEAEKALYDLHNTHDSGTSLVPLIPGSREPRWAQGSDKVALAQGTQDLIGVPYAYTNSGTIQTVTPDVQFVAVHPGVKYRFSFWARANVAGSRIYIEMRDQEGRHSVHSGGISSDGTPRSSSYLVAGLNLNQSWTKYESIIAFRDTARLVRPAAVYWQHGNGTMPAQQWIADLRIDPVIPTQEAVDKAQNDAIAANTEALRFQEWQNENQLAWNRMQETTNQIVRDGFVTQAQYNSLNNATNSAQNAAIRALAKPNLGGSLLGYVEPEGSSTEWVPAWTTAAWGKMSPTHSWVTSLPINADVYWADSSQGAKRAHLVRVEADPNLEYKVTFWARGAGNIYMSLLNQDGASAVASGGFTADGNNNGSRYLVGNLQLKSAWTRYESVITLKPETQRVHIGSIWWNHVNGTTTAPQAIAGLTISPNTPSQADVNASQAWINEKQDGINRTVAAFTDSQSQFNKDMLSFKTMQLAFNHATEGWIAKRAKWDEQHGEWQRLIEDQGKATQERMDAHEGAIEGLRASMSVVGEYISRIIVGTTVRETNYDDYWTIEGSGGISGYTLTAKPGWAGTAVIHGSTRNSVEGGWAHEPYARVIKITAAQREWKFTSYTPITVFYQVHRGQPKLATHAVGAIEPAHNTWQAVPSLSFTAVVDGDHIVEAFIGWNAATNDDRYGIRLVVNGNVVETIGPVTRLGPLFPGGANAGYREQWIRRTVQAAKGQTIAVQLFTTGGVPSQRRVRKGGMSIAYVQPPEE